MIGTENKDLGETLTEAADALDTVNVPETNVDAFRDRMKRLVGHVGSIASIARKCGIPESTVKKWVDGISDPSRGRCVALAHGTGISLLWLVAGEGDMLPATSGVAEPAASYRAASHPDEARRAPNTELLAATVRVVEGVLSKSGLRSRANPAQYAELVRIVYDQIERGSAEDAASEALGRILTIARTPAA